MNASRQLAHRRGQPLAVLGCMLVGWIGARAALWERIDLPGLPTPVVAAVSKVLPAALRSPVASLPQRHLEPQPPIIAKAAPYAARPRPLPPGAGSIATPADFGAAGGSLDGTRSAAAHQLAWMAGVAQLPVPSFVMDNLTQSEVRYANHFPAAPGRKSGADFGKLRWSGDGWLLLRAGGVGPTAAGLPSPTYGVSQIGGIVRYRLIPSKAQSPALFLRVNSALRVPRGEEAALGVAIRPASGLPVALQAELRATQQTSRSTLRPALVAVSQLPPVSLPHGVSAEIYGQAGYVGGPDSTAFVDGQLRIERRLARLGGGELRVGLGGWGGAQKGASRLDLGPTATLDFPLGGGQGRVAADWRLRTAGNAAPKSGPALTLSAGF